jgi:lactate permease
MPQGHGPTESCGLTDALANYSAVGHSLSLTAMVAALPIFFLFWVLAYKRMKGYLAASLTLLLMLLVAVIAYGMPARAAVSAGPF